LKAGLHELELWCLKATDQVTKYFEHKEKVQETPFLRFLSFVFGLFCSLLVHLGMNSNIYAKLWDFWYTLDKENAP